MIRILTIFAALVLGSSLGTAAERAIIVLDASGSMWGQIGGKTKIEIARETLGTVLQSLPADRELGMIAYGHREKGKCDDIELVIPAAPGTAAAIADAANRLNPKGKTPLSASVKQAAEALRYTEDKATVILITDGLETCDADPCALGRELEASGVDFTAHVVGFGLSEEEGRQVACLAENTGGKYIQAKDAAALGEALTETVVAEAGPDPQPDPEPTALDVNLKATATLSEGGGMLDDRAIRWDLWKIGADGEPEKQSKTDYGSVHEKFHEPGRYRLGARLGNASATTDIELAADALTEVSLNLNAGYLTLVGRRAADAEPDKGIRWDVGLPDGREATSYGGTQTFVVPAGSRKVRARLGKATVEETVEVAAGDRLTKEIIVATGRLVAYALYAEGGPEIGRDVRFDVLGAAKDIAGKRKDFGTNYGDGVAFDLPPGDYVLKATSGKATAETPVTVKGNERVEPRVVLNAGVLAITAPGGDRLDILGAEKDIQGKRKTLTTNYGEAWQIVLPEGDYVVQVRRQDKSTAEGTASVKAGQRTEVTVE
ncbi:MAG TPA: VWA domain-containing protein [Afifellaceae bacterium]|nr:VWA domain-containing protein [Afifellaceae bacterium]